MNSYEVKLLHRLTGETRIQHITQASAYEAQKVAEETYGEEERVVAVMPYRYL